MDLNNLDMMVQQMKQKKAKGTNKCVVDKTLNFDHLKR